MGTTSNLSIACPIRQEQGEYLSLNAWVVDIQLKAMGLPSNHQSEDMHVTSSLIGTDFMGMSRLILQTQHTRENTRFLGNLENFSCR